MSNNWPVGFKRVAWSLLFASFCLAVVLSPLSAQAADDKPAIDTPAVEKPAKEKSAKVDEPAAEEDAAKGQAKEDSVAEEPAKDEPAAEKTVADVEDEDNGADAEPADDAAEALKPAVTKGQIDSITGDTVFISFKVESNEGKNLQVVVFYGEKDGGDVQEDWQHNTGLVTYDKSRSRRDYTVKLTEGIEPLTSYFYRICAKTDNGATWSEPSEFQTKQAATPWYMVAAVVLGIVLLFAVPFLIGNYLAGRLKMPDHGWKIGLILWSLVVAAVVVGFGWPPHLGIDLSGGVILVYELEDPETDVVQKKADEKKADADKGEAKKDEEEQDEDSEARTVDMSKLMGAMALRINPGGTREITLRQYGPRQIEIIVPRASDEQVKRIEDKVSRAGTLSFRILANDTDHSDIIDLGRKTEGKRVKDAKGKIIAEWVPVTKGREDEFAIFKGIATRIENYAGEESLEILVVMDPYNVTGEFLDGTSSGYDDRVRPCVNFIFNSQGGRRFGALTSDNLPDEVGDFKRHLGIILDGYLYSAPYINGPITTRGQITGDFTQKEVKDLVDVLNAGSLPAALKKNPISRLSTGPTLGHDMIIRGAWAIGISLVVVLLFMVFYYRFSGLVACFALMMTLLLVLAVMIAVKADFTLPGIAGLVLTVGMAVDANVLIFERIREELAKNAALRMAIRNGFARATTTVVDANLTTLITATVLYVVGTEQIKGFAVTLWLGVVLSMFTAIFCSRVIFDVAERQRWIKKLSMLRILGNTNIDFIGKRYLGAAISIILIVVGLISVGARGKGLLDIDFTGGVSVQVLFKGPEEIKNVRESLSDLPDLAVSDVQLLEGEEAQRRFVINTSQQAPETDEAAGEADGGNAIAYVEGYIAKTFGDKLAANNMEIGEITPMGQSDLKDAGLSKGGCRIPLNFEHEVNFETLDDYIKTAYEENEEPGLEYDIDRESGFRKTDSQAYNDWIVTTAVPPEKARAIFEKLQAKLGAEPFFPSSSSIGGRVASDMQLKAIYALLASLLFIVGYIWIRFQRVMFGLAAVAALVHDVLITLGALAISAFVAPYLGFLMIDEFKIGLPVLAAFLTIIGYSLNDTIVVFDRIREVRGKSPDITGEMINTSVNQTLSRTVLTSLTTLIVVAILYVGGGQGIHAFAFSLMVGVIIGTYSSIFVASPILYWMGHSAKKLQKMSD